MQGNQVKPLPVTLEECHARGWSSIDIVLVTGDAYVDHPSFGIALIGRVLESRGYRVAVLPQPRFDSETDFIRFGRPNLFFGITGGNLDSIVSNYSGNGKVRDFDAYSPGGSPWRSGEQTKHNRYRPDRAVLIYANLARKAFKGVTVIIGGIEASLRRFVHYDYKQNRLRGSHLTDSKADLLVYGMGETAIVESAERIRNGMNILGIRGTCRRMNAGDIKDLIARTEHEDLKITTLPSWDQINGDKKFFLEAELIIDRHAREQSKAILIQEQQSDWVVQYPPNSPLKAEEMDHLYELPFSRKPHPASNNIPAYTMIKDSVTIVRGCSGNCSFCAISRHQGPATTSRNIDSIVAEAESIANAPDFNGTISDLGGPTANLFGTICGIGSCKKHDCLYPKVCKNLRIDEEMFIRLLDRVSAIGQVKHVHVSSGLRMELLLKAPGLFKRIVRNHIPGTLKIAPEHTEAEVLSLMHKESHSQLVGFIDTFRRLSRSLGVRRDITPYIISAHPGCTSNHTRAMVKKLKNLGLSVRQFQDFTPTPGTISTAMYVSGLHRDNGKKIAVARNLNERSAQRSLIEKSFKKRR